MGSFVAALISFIDVFHNHIEQKAAVIHGVYIDDWQLS